MIKDKIFKKYVKYCFSIEERKNNNATNKVFLLSLPGLLKEDVDTLAINLYEDIINSFVKDIEYICEQSHNIKYWGMDKHLLDIKNKNPYSPYSLYY